MHFSWKGWMRKGFMGMMFFAGFINTKRFVHAQNLPHQQALKYWTVVWDGEYRPGEETDDTIYYSPLRPLQWRDFTGHPPPGAHRNAAVTYSSFGFTGSAVTHHDTLEVHLQLQVFFVKSASYVIPAALPGPDALAHEQLHFDLTRISAAHFQQLVLENKKDIQPEDADSYIQYQYLEAFRYMNHIQDQFDSETQHGTNKAEEAKWAAFVHQQLRVIYPQFNF
jgi:hypothetical protein